MKTNILNHLPQKTRIYINNELRKELFNKIIKTTLNNLSKELSLKLKNISRYKTGTRAIPKEIFLELIKKSHFKLIDFQNKITIKVGKRGNKIKIGPFIQITPEWVYISELIRGDGSLVRGNNNSYKTCFTNKNLVLIKFVKNFFLNLKLNPKNISIYPNTKNSEVKNLVIHSETISYFLNSFFKIPFGYKKDIFVPKFILNNKNLTISAIRGIFDAEGTVISKKWKGHNLRNIRIGMKDKNYLKDVQKGLKKLNINSNLYKDNNMFRLIIGDRRSIIRFYRKIKPLHPEKLEKLRLLSKEYKKTKWIASKDINLKILKLLSKEPKRRSEICNIFKISYSQAGFYLKKLQENGLIKVKNKIFTNKGSWFVYNITKKGKNYLKESVTDLF